MLSAYSFIHQKLLNICLTKLFDKFCISLIMSKTYFLEQPQNQHFKVVKQKWKDQKNLKVLHITVFKHFLSKTYAHYDSKRLFLTFNFFDLYLIIHKNLLLRMIHFDWTGDLAYPDSLPEWKELSHYFLN